MAGPEIINSLADYWRSFGKRPAPQLEALPPVSIPIFPAIQPAPTPPISLTSLTIVEDDTMPLTEVRVHPELVYRVRRAFVEADVLRSVHPSNPKQFPHPFSSVGDEEIEE